MTVNSIKTKARRILQDAQMPYRWSDGDIRSAIQDGINSLNSIRPETRYVRGSLVDLVSLPTDNDATIDIHDRYEEALVFYAVYKCYLDDDSDTVNHQLSELYLGKFNTKVQL